MGIETLFFAFLSEEFKESIGQASETLPISEDNADKDENWSVIVEMTPFLKHMTADFKTGRDFFIKKIKPVIENYRRYGYKHEHLVFDNGAPSVKYVTHMKRYSSDNDHPYPLSFENILENINQKTQTAEQGDETVKIISTMSDNTMIKSKSWSKYLTNRQVVQDIIAYITNMITLSDSTREFAIMAGVDVPDAKNLFFKRTIIPTRDSTINVYCGILDHKPHAQGDSITKTVSDDCVLVVDTFDTKKSNETFSKETLKRTREGEMTCGMIAFEKIKKDVNEYLTNIADFVIKVQSDPTLKEPKNNSRILIDSVDGDLIAISLMLYKYSIQYADNIRRNKGLSKVYTKLAVPKIGVWLRQSGKKKKVENSTTIFNPGQPDKYDEFLKSDGGSIPVEFQEINDPIDKKYSKIDWRESREAIEFDTKPMGGIMKQMEGLIGKERLIESDETPSRRSTKFDKYNTSTPTRSTFEADMEAEHIELTRNARLRGDSYNYQDDDSCDSYNYQDSVPSLHQESTRLSRNFTGSYVDIDAMYDKLHKHSTFSNVTDPVSVMVFISALCGNDYIQKSIPGLTSGTDKYKRPWFFLPFCYSHEFDNLVHMSWKTTDCSFNDIDKPGNIIKVECNISQKLFVDYVHSVYYYKYRDVVAVSKKAEALYKQRYSGNNIIKTTVEQYQDSNSADIYKNAEERMKKECYVEIIMEHLSTKKNPMLTREQIAGLKARLVWFLEYTSSAPLNRGYYPNPLMEHKGKSVYGWKIPTTKNKTPALSNGKLVVEETNNVIIDAQERKWYEDVSHNYCDWGITSLGATVDKSSAQSKKEVTKSFMNDSKRGSDILHLMQSVEDAKYRESSKNIPTFESIFLKNERDKSPTITLGSNNSDDQTIIRVSKDFKSIIPNKIQNDTAIDDIASNLGLELMDDDCDNEDDLSTILNRIVKNDEPARIEKMTKIPKKAAPTKRKASEIDEPKLKLQDLPKTRQPINNEDTNKSDVSDITTSEEKIRQPKKSKRSTSNSRRTSRK